MSEYSMPEDKNSTIYSLRVPEDKPESELRTIDKLALEKCDGYIIAAYDYMFKNMDHDFQSAVTKEITVQESHLFFQYIAEKTADEYGTAYINLLAKKEMKLQQLGMTEEQVKETEKNPFSKKAWLSLGILLAAFTLLLAIAFIIGNVAPLGDTAANIVSIFTYTLLLGGLGYVVAVSGKALRFRKAKKLIVKIENYQPQKDPKSDVKTATRLLNLQLVMSILALLVSAAFAVLNGWLMLEDYYFDEWYIMLLYALLVISLIAAPLVIFFLLYTKNQNMVIKEPIPGETAKNLISILVTFFSFFTTIFATVSLLVLFNILT